MTGLTSAKRRAHDAAADARRIAAVAEAGAAFAAALDAARADAGPRDQLRAAAGSLVGSASRVHGLTRALKDLRGEQGLVMTGWAELATGREAALRDIEGAPALALRAAVAGDRDLTAAVRLGAEHRAAVETQATAGLAAEIAARESLGREELAAEGRLAEVRRAARVRAVVDETRAVVAARFDGRAAERRALCHARGRAAELLPGAEWGCGALARLRAGRDLCRVAIATEATQRPGAVGLPVDALRFAAGGEVQGAGGPRDDRVLALLSNGEFVVNAGAAVRHRAILRAINGEGGNSSQMRTAAVNRFAKGGEVRSDPNAIKPLTIHLHRKPIGKNADIESNKAQLANELSKAGLNDGEQEQIFGQVQAESRFRLIQEDVGRYSAKNLVKIFPRYVHGVEDARALVARGPAAIAERIYGGRMGNDRPGDGFRYRGRGYIQLTGHKGYAEMDKKLGLNGALLADPDLADDPLIAARIAAAYYRQRSAQIHGQGKGLYDLTTAEGATKATGPATKDAAKTRGTYAERYRGRTGDYAARGAALTIHGPAAQPTDRSEGAPRRYASGGEVRGPGGPTSDMIPARLSPGEFVVNASATARHRALIEAINTGTIDVPGYSKGGSVPLEDRAPGAIGFVQDATNHAGASIRYNRQHRGLSDDLPFGLRGDGPHDPAEPVVRHPVHHGPRRGPHFDDGPLAPPKPLLPMPEGSGRIDPKSFRGLLLGGESHGDPGIYNYNAHGHLKTGHFDPDQMSVGDLQGLQRRGKINAAGTYQIIPSTMRGAVAALHIRPGEKFSPELQDRIFTDWLASGKRPQIRNYITGRSDDLDAAHLATAQEWASVDWKGRSYWGGHNKGSISDTDIRSALQHARALYQRLVGGHIDPETARRAATLGIEHPTLPSPRQQDLIPDRFAHGDGRNFAERQRAAERAVVSHREVPGSASLTSGVAFDHSGVREALHHVRMLKEELASLGSVDLRVRHVGFGHRGDHAPGAVRAALNGNFGSDGRAFG